MHLNIHPATLFLDLEGLARFITLKNELFPIHAGSDGPPAFDPTQMHRLMADRAAGNTLRRTGNLNSATVQYAYDHALTEIRVKAAEYGDRVLSLDEATISKIAVAATMRAIDGQYNLLSSLERPTPDEFKALKDSLQRRTIGA